MAETDYLIIGAGAVGMAFADTLLTETDAHLTIVDREAAPGGHWNHAYPFVALHQPSMLYGVNSLPLGSGAKDTNGHNAGLYELSSGTEVRAYFDQVMRRIFLPSGRVTYHPWRSFARRLRPMRRRRWQPARTRQTICDPSSCPYPVTIQSSRR